MADEIGAQPPVPDVNPATPAVTWSDVGAPDKAASDSAIQAASQDKAWQDYITPARKRAQEITTKAQEDYAAGGYKKAEVVAGSFVESNITANVLGTINTGVADLITRDESDQFNFLDHVPEGYEPYLANFSDAEGPLDIQQIKNRIDQELTTQAYSKQHPVIATALGITGGVADVSIFLPGGAAVKAASAVPGAKGLLFASFVGGSVAGAQAIPIEAALHSMQETRTMEQSRSTVLFSAALGTILTGAGIGVARRFGKASPDLPERIGNDEYQAPVEVIPKNEENAARDLADIASRELYEDNPVGMRMPENWERDLGTGEKTQAPKENDIPSPAKSEAKAVASAISPEAELSARAYMEPDFTTRLANDGDEQVRSLGEALTSTAKDYADLHEGISDGVVAQRLDISNEINLAAKMVQEARALKKDVLEVVSAQGEQVNARMMAVLRMFYGDDKLTTLAKKEEISKNMKEYVRQARKVTQSEDLYDTAPVMPETILNRILKGIDSEHQLAEPTMSFDAQIKSDVQEVSRLSESIRKRMENNNDGGVGGGAQAVASPERSKLLAEKTVRLYAKAGMADGLGSARFTNEALGLALSPSPSARIYGARLLDTGLFYEDPNFIRNGKVPAVSAKEQDVILNNARIDRAHKQAYAEFMKEAREQGITKDLRETYNQELYTALVRKDGSSYFQSVQKAASELGKVRDELIAKGKEFGLVDNESVKFAEKYLPRRYNAERIRDDEKSFIDYLVRKFKEYMGDEDNPHYEMLQEVANEYEKRASKDVQALYGIKDKERIAEFVRQDFDQFLTNVARDSRKHLMDPQIGDGSLTYRSAFQNMKRDRTLAIPDEDLIADGWLVVDPIDSLVRLNRRMTSEVTLMKYFDTTNVKDVTDKITRDFDNMIARGETHTNALGKEVKVTDKERQEAVAAMRVSWSKFLDTFGYMANPATNSGAGASFLRIANPIVDSQVLTVAPLRNVYELLYAARDDIGLTFKHLLKATPGIASDIRKLKKNDLKRLGVALEMQLRGLHYQDPGTVAATGRKMARIETGIGNAAQFYKTWVDFTLPFQTFMDNVNGSIIQESVISRAARVFAGKPQAQDASYLAHLGIGDEMAQRIGKELKEHMVEEKGYLFDNHQDWQDLEAADIFRQAVFYGKKRIGPNTKYDTPAVFQNNLLGVLFARYVGAVMSAYQRSVIAAAQKGNGRAISMAIGLTAAGALSAMVKDAVDGKSADEPMNYISRGWLASGGGGFTTDLYTRAKNAYSGITGDADLASGFGGVYYSTGEKAANVVGGGVNMVMGKRPTKRQISDTIGAIPGNRLLHLRPIFNGIEDEIRVHFGYDERYGAPFSGEKERRNK